MSPLPFSFSSRDRFLLPSLGYEGSSVDEQAVTTLLASELVSFILPPIHSRFLRLPTSPTECFTAQHIRVGASHLTRHLPLRHEGPLAQFSRDQGYLQWFLGKPVEHRTRRLAGRA